MKTAFFLKLFLLLNLSSYAQNIFDASLYDTIYFKTTNFVIAKQSGSIKLFNKSDGIYSLDGFVTISGLMGSDEAYQVVVADSLKLINSNGEIVKKLHFRFEQGLCGTVRKHTLQILNKKDSTFLRSTSRWFAGDDEVETIHDTMYYLTYKSQLIFLNKKDIISFTGNDQFDERLGTGFFLEKKKGKKISLVSIEYNTNNPYKKEYITKNIDSVFQSDYIFPFKFFQPFRFKKANLFGYYPFVKDAKYKYISSFDKNYAAFLTKDNKKGWLTTTGEEFFY